MYSNEKSIDSQIYLTVTKYASGDHKFCLTGCSVGKGQKGHSNKKAIKAFTPESIKRCRLALRATSELWQVTATLTYPLEYAGLLDGRESKRHLDNFIYALKRHVPGIKYAWVLEFQTKTRNPHYHLLLSHFVDCEWVARTWYRVVGSGLEKHLFAGTSTEAIRDKTACSDYIARYLGKTNQKILPPSYENVGRWWGMTRGLSKQYAIDINLGGYETPNDCRRDLRSVKRARKAKLRELGISWKPRRNGYTDMQTSESVVDELIENMAGEVISLVPF